MADIRSSNHPARTATPVIRDAASQADIDVVRGLFGAYSRPPGRLLLALDSRGLVATVLEEARAAGYGRVLLDFDDRGNRVVSRPGPETA